MVSVGIVMLVIFTSIGYSALATSFLVSGEAHLRVKADIRITDIKRIESSNSGYETYNPEYSKEGTKIFTTLPNIDSTLTYQVEITNTSSYIYALKEINEILNSNPNIEYVIENIKEKDRIEAGSTVKFNITVKYKEGLTEVPEDKLSVIELNYKFEIPDSTPPEVMFSLQEGSYTGNRIVTITATDIGGSGYDFMNIEVHNSEGKVESKSNSRVTDDTYSVTLDSASIWTIYVQAYDKAGNKQITEPLNENGFTYRAYKIKEDKTLYGVLQKEAAGNRYAKEYTGEHQDSIEGLGNKKIYHYYAANNTDGTAVLDKNNVIFAGFCWQMMRTTDTGGVKLIYNGEPDSEGKCGTDRGTHVGYSRRTSTILSSNYYYGTSYNYDEASKTFSLSGEKTLAKWDATVGPTLIGKYTCKKATEDGTCTTLYYVESYYTTSSGYVLELNSSSNYSQFGTVPFNASYDSPAYVGYMYNTVYPYQSKSTSAEIIYTISSLGTGYWYADSVKWNSTTKKYELVNPYKVSSTEEYPNLIGKYTFKSSSETYTNSSVQYIIRVNNTTYHYIQLLNGNDLDYYNYSYTYGDSYSDNGAGTYTINNPTTIKRTEWYENYSNMNNRYVCKNAINNTCSELWYIMLTGTTSFQYLTPSYEYKFAKGFTYENGVYKLNDESVSFWDISDSVNKSSINNAHYTCFNESGECSSISYIFYINGASSYYINLTDGKSVEDALIEMFSSDDVNKTNSIIKTVIDDWYEKYLIDYTDNLEDTIFCNDRSVSNLGGWNPNGGSVTSSLAFKESNLTKDLTCENVTDRFSVNNNKAKLKYPVGLMSRTEMILLNNDNIRKTGQQYWLASPNYFMSNVAVGCYVSTKGSLNNISNINNTNGVRPSVSLKPGTIYSSGDGSMANPYIVGEGDNVSPTLSFNLDEGVYEDNQTVTITTTDDNFDHMDVQVLYEGEVVKELKSVFTNTINIELDRKGVWTISVIAYDEAGNTQEGGSFLSGRTYKNYIIGKDNTLYGVLKKEAEGNRFAKEYTGVHQDSIEGTGNKKIYHYYADSSTDDAITVKNKNNVIFAGFCWQMMRTTDTGGVKLIYNGEAVDGKCLSERGNDTGVNEAYDTKKSLNDNYVYGTSYIYDESTKTFTLAGSKTTKRWSNATYKDLLGLYTCGSTSDTCAILYHVNEYINATDALVRSYTVDTTHYSNIGMVSFNDAYNSPAYLGYMYNTVYPYQIKSTIDSNEYIDELYGSTYVYTFGDSYIENSDGTYTINNPITITTVEEWQANYSSLNNKYFCKNAVNNTCTDILYTTSTSSSDFSYTNPFKDENYKYAKGFIYENGKYKLNDGIVSLSYNAINENPDSLSNAHYTCFNGSGECESIAYVYNYSGSMYYINITGGKGIGDALKEMLNADNVNKTNSNIKTLIDSWYESHLIDYTDYLEDTIFCNDRSITSLGGWNPNGGDIYEYLYFKEYDEDGNVITSDLSCPNVTDRFSVNNSKAKLKYPVGLMSYSEITLFNDSTIGMADYNEPYWLLSPAGYDAFGGQIDTVYYMGGLVFTYSNDLFGVRPAISLRPNTVYSSGDGTVDNPYIVNVNKW